MSYGEFESEPILWKLLTMIFIPFTGEYELSNWG